MIKLFIHKEGGSLLPRSEQTAAGGCELPDD
jgi:hypothetical protein